MALHVKDRDTALYGGIAALLMSIWLLHEAFEGRGQPRPWLLRIGQVVS